MGGNRWAQVIAAGSTLFSGVSLSQGSIFMYISFDFLWRVVVAFGVISLLKTSDARWWLAIGVPIGLGMMTKQKTSTTPISCFAVICANLGSSSGKIPTILAELPTKGKFRYWVTATNEMSSFT
jgi:hypothetical protein